MPEKSLCVGVLGAGAIGCFVGGSWVAAGIDVRLVGRQTSAETLRAHGLKLSGVDVDTVELAPGQIDCVTDPAILSQVSIVVLAVKGPGMAAAAQQIKHHTGADVPVVSLLNGATTAQRLATLLPGRQVIPGMVPFNVAELAPGHWHKASKGRIVIEDDPQINSLVASLHGSSAAIEYRSDMTQVLWGKLLMNLNNPINALSGLSLHQQLSDHRFRRLYSKALREALAVLASAGIKPAKVGALPANLIPAMLETPNWCFNNIGLRLQKIDHRARSSMADDFARKRPTEIDLLNGEIVRLAKATRLTAPINARLVDLVKQAERGGYQPLGEALLDEFA